MNVANAFTIALKAIWLNKRRSFLTMLGVMIGVGSVVLLTSIGTGLQAYITEQFNALGGNVLFVVPGKPFSNGGFGSREDAIIERTQPVLRRTDLNRILRQQRTMIYRGVATGISRAEAKYRNITKRVTLYGTTDGYEIVNNSPTTKGAWFTASDDIFILYSSSKIAETMASL
jgi:putative ABC transport system permease protein